MNLGDCPCVGRRREPSMNALSNRLTRREGAGRHVVHSSTTRCPPRTSPRRSPCRAIDEGDGERVSQLPVPVAYEPDLAGLKPKCSQARLCHWYMSSSSGRRRGRLASRAMAARAITVFPAPGGASRRRTCGTGCLSRRRPGRGEACSRRRTAPAEGSWCGPPPHAASPRA